MEEVGIPGNIQKAIVDNHEPNADGIYPDWADKDYVFKHRELKIVKLFERHRNAAIHWFQNGHPVKSWITDWGERETGGTISKEWYNIKRRKTSALWEQQQDVHKGCVVPMSEL